MLKTCSTTGALEGCLLLVMVAAGAVLGVMALLVGRAAGFLAWSSPARVGNSSALCFLMEASGEGAAAAGGRPRPAPSRAMEAADSSAP